MSRAVVPPSAISQAVHIANIYENAAVAKSSGDPRPTITTENVCSEFCNVYARITGIEAFKRIVNSCNITLQRDFGSSDRSYISPFSGCSDSSM